ncbi:MAG: sulfurtransferase-like selenium metabolism protein YedF [Chitinivibrionales bacterium]|nr:sulfurtransferase-like selenium metabolism protein YedF [Chitinivibrionales bacterium]
MSKKIVDAQGQVCPKPLILTKKALQDLDENEHMTVLIDNATSKENVERFLHDNDIGVKITQEGSVYSLLVTKTISELAKPDEQAYCPVPASGSGSVICFKSNRMGLGDDDLGDILIKAFVNTIKEINPLPKQIICYTSGIFLALADSPVLKSLQELEHEGVSIIVCGTCADYYGRKANVKVGIISNMYDIMETLSTAAKVIYP